MANFTRQETQIKLWKPPKTPPGVLAGSIDILDFIVI